MKHYVFHTKFLIEKNNAPLSCLVVLVSDFVENSHFMELVYVDRVGNDVSKKTHFLLEIQLSAALLLRRQELSQMQQSSHEAYSLEQRQRRPCPAPSSPQILVDLSPPFDVEHLDQ